VSFWLPQILLATRLFLTIYKILFELQLFISTRQNQGRKKNEKKLRPAGQPKQNTSTPAAYS
jgi:hypothetical protein